MRKFWRRRDVAHLGKVWRRRVATAGGAILLSLVALAFAFLADKAQQAFAWLAAIAPVAPLALTPAAFAAIVWLTVHHCPQGRGSGIPQVIVRARHPESLFAEPLTSLRTAGMKFALTIIALLGGASVGREGPTVQISAAVMQAVHRLFNIRITPGIIIAGGAAGVSAAFNTPLAGVAFAIEELASAYEQKLALLVMAAVMIAGLVSLGLAGDYLYFGAMHGVVSVRFDLLVCPLAGVLGGLAGGLFSRALLAWGTTTVAPIAWLRQHPVLAAAGCGLAVALIGLASGGATWGTGYEPARALIEGEPRSLAFGPAKLATTLLTALSGMPGGIFAPSLATGAGLGNIIASWFPQQPTGAIVILGMIAYFVGVVRAPLTAVLITSEMTDSRAMILPLFAAAIIADGVSAIVCRERLYHGLARAFDTSHQSAPDEHISSDHEDD